jgi:hypothetical protein
MIHNLSIIICLHKRSNISSRPPSCLNRAVFPSDGRSRSDNQIRSLSCCHTIVSRRELVSGAEWIALICCMTRCDECCRHCCTGLPRAVPVAQSQSRVLTVRRRPEEGSGRTQHAAMGSDGTSCGCVQSGRWSSAPRPSAVSAVRRFCDRLVDLPTWMPLVVSCSSFLLLHYLQPCRLLFATIRSR